MNLFTRFFNIVVTLLIFAVVFILIAGSYDLLSYPDIDWLSVVRVDMGILGFASGIFLAFFGFKSAHGILKDIYGKPKSVKEKEMVN